MEEVFYQKENLTEATELTMLRYFLRVKDQNLLIPPEIMDCGTLHQELMKKHKRVVKAITQFYVRRRPDGAKVGSLLYAIL
jgi:hypothetical protein